MWSASFTVEACPTNKESELVDKFLKIRLTRSVCVCVFVRARFMFKRITVKKED